MPARDKIPETQDVRYWIAINGPTCALSALPWQNPMATPTPEQLLGFPTLEEAQCAQEVCLTAPIHEVASFLKSLTPDVKAGRIRVIQPAHPQPPTDETTFWTESPEVHQAIQTVHIKTTSN